MGKSAIIFGVWLGIPVAYLIVGSCAVSFGFAMGVSVMAFAQVFIGENGSD